MGSHIILLLYCIILLYISIIVLLLFDITADMTIYHHTKVSLYVLMRTYVNFHHHAQGYPAARRLLIAYV